MKETKMNGNNTKYLQKKGNEMNDKNSQSEIIWLSPKEVEEKYNVSKGTQAKYRMKSCKNRIPHSKIGKFIFYKKSALDEWIEKHEVSSL